MFNNISSTEIIIIGIIAVLVFGSTKLKEFARGAGESTKELKKIKKEFEKAVEEHANLPKLIEEEIEKEEKKGGGD